MGVVIMPMSAMSGKTGGGSGEGEEGGSSQSIGSVLIARDWRFFGGVQTVDLGAKKPDFLLPIAGNTMRLSDVGLQRRTR